MLDSEEYFQKSFSRNSCGNYNWVDTGCGNKQVEESEKTDNAEVTSTETVYVPEYISLPESFVKTNDICSYDGKLYFACYIEEKTKDPESGENDHL